MGGGFRVVVKRNARTVQRGKVGGRVERGQLPTDVRPQSTGPDIPSSVDEVAVYPAGCLVQLDSKT